MGFTVAAANRAVIDGDWMGARGGMERDIEALYQSFIQGLVRENPPIMEALTD